MDQPKILVAIRKRPLSKKEQSKGQTDIISVKNKETVIVSQYKQKVDLTKYLEETVFNFDFAFNEETTNQQIYEEAVRPLVDSAFQGAKVTCFAYGQTGSGKTFTMNGNQKMGVLGLYTLGATDIFAYLSDSRFRHLTAKLSFFEIYCGKLFDLLNKRAQLTLREDNKQNINIIGLQQTQIDSLEKFQQLLSYGSIQRITSQNSANAQSSRSHAILQVTLKQGKKIYGKISFIDLAGNERGADHTDMKKQTRIDGAEINKSLLSLKQCIRALDQGKGHTPFRGSKLTMVLKDSFVGFCRTIMIGNISPSSASSQNTLNTLRYADRVKQLRKPSEGLTKQQLKARQMMLPRQNNNAIKIDITKDDDAEDIEAKRREAQRNYGIREEPHSNYQHIAMQREMSSDPYRRNAQNERTRQQSFGGPSSQLFQGIRQSQQMQPLQLTSQTQPLINQPKSPSVSNNLTKLDIRNNQKTTIPSDRNIYTNNSAVIQQQQPNYYQPNGPKLFNQQTKVDIEQPKGISNSQNLNRHNNNFFQNPNNQNNRYANNIQPPQQQTNQYGGYQNQYQVNSRPGTGQSYQNEGLNQYRSNYQQPDQRINNIQPGGFANRQNQYKQQVPQKILLPTDWDGMIEFVSTTTDPQLRHIVHQKLHEYLLNQQNDLIASHSDTLRNSLDYFKSQTSMIADIQNNREAVSTRSYLQVMQQSIDQKISLLEMLRQKMIQFTYKLQRVEEIDEQNENIIPRGSEDEQLLDDLH